MSKQTAVEWLIHELRLEGFIDNGDDLILIEHKALAMEREQKKQDIHNYFEWHKSKGYVSHQPIDIKQYYEETYGKEADNAN